MPQTTPPTTPMKKPRAVSSRVTRICSQSGPWDVPSVAQIQICSAMPVGLAKKKGSMKPTLAPISQRPSVATRKAMRKLITSVRLAFSRARALVSISTSVGTARAVGAVEAAATACAGMVIISPFRFSVAGVEAALLADLHFLAQIVPDGAALRDEGRVVADLLHDPRARQVDLVDALDGGGAGRQHIDLVGE